MAHQFSKEAVERVKKLKDKYPDSQSAVMPALYVAQEEIGFVNQEAIDWVAEQVDMAPVHVKELATFYTMYYQQPVGKYHFQVCRTLSCAVRGSKKLMNHLKNRFGVDPHEVTEDGMWSYEAVECLGSCGTAPMCEINDRFFENLTPELLEDIINKIEKEKPDLRYSTKLDKLGDGLSEYPCSVIRPKE
ncbi:MAG: NAD(P)H-dependent oxidoreductase subunit E [Bdellovibrionales bacterium]|nr:NAD(P)H-dependent oxidoreductase subunit E [Bdellovibrionales bacterium]